MRLIVTGSRSWLGRASVWMPLDRLRLKHGTLENPLLVSNGKASRGLDQLVSEWIEEYEGEGVVEIPFVADWDGPARRQAGFIRNQRMVDEGADMLLVWANPCRENKPWCPSGAHPTHGTADCVRRARDSGIPVHFCPRGMSW